MKLRYDPFQVFRGSQTPAGLYARQKWLGEAETPAWRKAFQAKVKALSANQSANGSWHQSTWATIKNLFGLHLTLRLTNNQVDTALSWLLGRICLRKDGIGVSPSSGKNETDFAGLPFVPSRLAMLTTGATLFLATLFDRSEDPTVLALYRWLSQEGFDGEHLSTDIASLHNVFRAMVVHPLFAEADSTVKTVEIFAELQTESGAWGAGLPFYQTLNALAHLNSRRADVQLEKAFTRLKHTQNSDGTWGRQDIEWNTFLSIHALKNKGFL